MSSVALSPFHGRESYLLRSKIQRVAALMQLINELTESHVHFTTLAKPFCVAIPLFNQDLGCTLACNSRASCEKVTPCCGFGMVDKPREAVQCCKLDRTATATKCSYAWQVQCSARLFRCSLLCVGGRGWSIVQLARLRPEGDLQLQPAQCMLATLPPAFACRAA